MSFWGSLLRCAFSLSPRKQKDSKNSFKKLKKLANKKPSPPNFGPEATDIHVRLPVFTVHGNHDDPGGADHLSAVDMLSTARLVNYFGKQPLSGSGAGALSLAPIVLAKGGVRVALYGLGAIRDERVARVFGGLAGATTVTTAAPNRDEEGEDGGVDDGDDDERTAATATNKRARRDHDNNNNAAAHFPDSSGIAWVPAPGGSDACFNLFVLHQNRVYRGHNAKNAVPEMALPDFLDFVVWGHEHECRPTADRGAGEFWFFLFPFEIKKSEEHERKKKKTHSFLFSALQKNISGGAKSFDVLQPGSTVATALSEGEAAPKHAFLLEIRPKPSTGGGGGNDGDGNADDGTGFHCYRLLHLPLRSPRPFAFGDVVLRDALPPQDRGDPRKMVELLDSRVERLIASARSASAAAAAASGLGGGGGGSAAAAFPPKLPLVRLRIDYTDVTTLSSAKLAARYVGRVANPGDLFLWHKARRGLGGRPAGGGGARGPLAIIGGGEGGGGDDATGGGAYDALQAPPPPAELDDRAIASLVAEHLTAEAAAAGGGAFCFLFFSLSLGKQSQKEEKKNLKLNSHFFFPSFSFNLYQPTTQAASPS